MGSRCRLRIHGQIDFHSTWSVNKPKREARDRQQRRRRIVGGRLVRQVSPTLTPTNGISHAALLTQRQQPMALTSRPQSQRISYGA